jgi:hypothetical protein
LTFEALLRWVIVLLLAVALVYSVFFTASQLGDSFFVLSHRSVVQYDVASVLVSPDIDGPIWYGAVLLVAIWLFSTMLIRKVGRLSLLLVSVVFVLVGVSLFGFLGFLPLVFASLILFTVFAFFAGSCFGFSAFSVVKRVVLCVVLIFVFIEAGALVLFNVPAVLNFPVGGWALGLHWQLLALSVSNLVYPLVPYAYLVFIVLGVAVFLLRAFPAITLIAQLGSARFLRFVRRGRDLIELGQSCEPLSGRFPLVAAVLVSVFLSCFFVVVTVLPWVNPTYRLVSVDAAPYYTLIQHMRGLDVNSAFSWAFGTDRPVFLVFLALLSYVVPPLHLVQFFPALLIPLLCIVSVLSLRLFCPLREALVYTALLAPFSVAALGLLYSGYFANMLAIILVYEYFILLVKVFRGGSSLEFFALLSVSVLVLFVHLATWLLLTAALTAFLFLEWRQSIRDRGLRQIFRWKFSIVGATIAVGLVCEVVRETIVPWSTASFVSQNVGSTFGLPSGGFVLSALRSTADFYLGGVFGFAALVFLSVVGFLLLLRFKSVVSNLFVSWVFVSSVYMLFASGEYVFNRFLFMMPSLMFSGLGLSFLVRSTVWPIHSIYRRVFVEILVLLFVFLVLLNFSLNYVLNLNAT